VIKRFFQYVDINESIALKTTAPISMYIDRLVQTFQRKGAIIEKVTADSVDFSVPLMERITRGSYFQGISSGKLALVSRADSIVLKYQISILPIRILAIGFVLFGVVSPVYSSTSRDVEFFPLYLLALIGALIMAALAYFAGMFFVILRIEDFLLKTLKTKSED